MKTQHWFTEAQRDLLLCALNNMRAGIVGKTENSSPSYYTTEQNYACHYTARRIDELIADLKREPKQENQHD